MQYLILPNFKKSYLNPSLYVKVMTILPKHVRVTVLEGGNRNRVRQKLAICDVKG
jgi:hypothetical protein